MGYPATAGRESPMGEGPRTVIVAPQFPDARLGRLSGRLFWPASGPLLQRLGRRRLIAVRPHYRSKTRKMNNFAPSVKNIQIDPSKAVAIPCCRLNGPL